MRRAVTTWLVSGLLALTATAWAQQTTPPAGQEKDAASTAASTHTEGHSTVAREDVRTWTIDVDDREYEAHPATPTYEGTTGLFHMPSAYTLPKGRFSFSLFRDNLDRDPKDEDISIHGVSLGYGISSRFELYGNFGLQNRLDADALFQPGFVNDYPFVSTPWETGVGDLKIGAKYGFLNDYRGDAVGLAVRGFVKIPTADEDKGLGTGKVSWGGDLVISKSLAEKADIHASVGFVQNGDPDGVEIGNAFRWSVGLNLPACTWFQVQAELMKTNYTGDDDFEQTNPLDLVVGPVLWIRPGIFIRPALSWNLNFDDRGLNSGSKSWTGRHISIGFHPGFGCREIAVAVAPPPPPPPPANNNPTVNCEIERSEISPGETVRVRANGSDADGDTLTYEWSASVGRIVGTGAQVTFDSTGMSPGSSATVTVRVSDGRGGTASSTCSVRTPAVKGPVSVTTCVAGGFPRNLARLTNVDKACLDDVATRLRTEGRTRITIIGHADASERYPEVISRKRAEAAKEYLVKERGVDASRITVRGRAAEAPIEKRPGSPLNRRVEVYFELEAAPTR
jgi:outer membrane protein OmpA-like peptidoglycan-associated protein